MSSTNPYVYLNTSQKLKEIADILNEVMEWHATGEGHTYWHQVHTKILNHSKLAATHPGPFAGGILGLTGEEVQNGFRQTILQTYHILNGNYTLCGLSLGSKKKPTLLPRGHSFVNMKDSSQSTCFLCKSKLLNA